MHGSAVQIAFLFLQIFWMFSVSGSRSMCALVCSLVRIQPKGLHSPDNGFTIQADATDKLWSLIHFFI